MLNKTARIRQEMSSRREQLYQLAWSWCHEAALADDLVQETMLKALKYSKQLNDMGAIRPWLARILSNCWYDYLRTRRDTVDIDNLPYISQLQLQDHSDTQDFIPHVRRLMESLPTGQRQAITLVDIAGYSYAEVADILEIPIGTVMSRISRARSTLRTGLGEFNPRHEESRAVLRSVK